MPRCCSQTTSCQCVIEPGTGVSISGSGSTDDPYVITAPDVVTLRGDVDPEGAVVGNPGDIYTSTDVAATLGQTTWQKATGTGDTGWVLIAGDTGWRDISATIINGWTGTVAIRRVNNTVDVRVAALDATSATNAVVAPVPSGFGLGAGSLSPLPASGSLSSSTAAVPLVLKVSNTSISTTSLYLVVGSLGSDYDGSAVGESVAAWPNALPGIPLA